MHRDSLALRHEIFFSTALLASHASFKDTGFRVRDVIFFIELFSNWSESALEDHCISPQTVQVSRYLASLNTDGLAKKLSRKRPTYYGLTRAGVIELLNRLVHQNYSMRKEFFFFVFSFIEGYRERLVRLAEQEGRTFPPAIRLELSELLDARALLNRERISVETEIKKLKTRIDAARNASYRAEELFKAGTSVEETSRHIELEYPYELNSTKPLSELIGSIQPDQRKWELVEGARYRSLLMWQPSLSILQCYLEQLEKLKVSLGKQSQ